jgi:RecB family exonuclease
MSTAGLCLARYKAENIDYARGESNTAALEGTALHGALEMYVKRVHLEKAEPASVDSLLAYYKMSYMTTFGSSDYTTDEYKEGVRLLRAWFKREEFSSFRVVSCEVKESFMIPVTIGGRKEEIPFNYIWDRHDDMGGGVYRVVDYKSNRAALTPGDLRDKLQARCYALACQIKHPDATQIWVEFDMLRHDGRVGTVFSREDNISTWKFLKAEAQRIIDTDDSKPLPETINPECGFCVRKATCGALKKNIAAGGVFSLDPVQRVDVRAQLADQKKAIEAALKEIDKVILAEAKESDITELEGTQYKQIITVRSQRTIDPDMAFQVIGPELSRKYGGANLTMQAVDVLLEGDELTEHQKSQLRGLITKRTGNPYVTNKRKGKI